MTADETRTAVIATARSLDSQLKYSNAWVGATLAQLKARGAGDCSDFTQACFGEHGYTLSGMSYDQASDGVEIASWKGAKGGANSAFIAIQPRLKPADLICMAIDSSRPGTISHVEIWIGDGISIGHGGPGYGPTEHAITDWNLLQSATYWTVRRIVQTNPQEEEDMPSAQEIANALLDTAIARQGGAKGTTNLRTELAWMTTNQGKAIGPTLDQIQKAILDTQIDRAGGRMSGKTSLRALIAWSDDHIIQLTDAITKSLSTLPGVSADDVKDALDEAISGLKITLSAEAD